MFIVALTALRNPVAAEATALAADLRILAFEASLKLRVGFPAIVLSTPDRARAETLLLALTARGTTASLLDTTDVVSADAMISLRRFRYDDHALIAGDEALAWADIKALFLATHRRQSSSTAVVKETAFDLTRAIATGGLVVTKTSKREVEERVDQREPVLYVWPRDARTRTPWILREQGTHYEALGATIATTSPRNFVLTTALLRARATQAVFDDRLLLRKVAPDELDVLAHILAATI